LKSLKKQEIKNDLFFDSRWAFDSRNLSALFEGEIEMTLFDIWDKPQTPKEAISDASLGKNKSKYPITVAKGKTYTSAKVSREKGEKFKSIRERVLDLFMNGFSGSPDDCAHALGLNILQVRPRTTELKKLGLLTVSSIKGKSELDNSAEVLRYRGEG